ncbi:hypothetical protein KI387_013126, partial [Taxus chinensis]
MEKAKLQTYAQRKGVQYPCYECRKEGPQHCPRFTASVIFNGQTFLCPSFFNKQKDAENAAAQLVLKSITPPQDIHANHQDERDINLEYKVLLLEASQKAKIPAPVYVTLGAGPSHLPTFTSSVQVIGVSFTGDPSQTKKQAERNAASAAWSSLKRVGGEEDKHGALEAKEQLEFDAVVDVLKRKFDGV